MNDESKYRPIVSKLSLQLMHTPMVIDEGVYSSAEIPRRMKSDNVNKSKITQIKKQAILPFGMHH